MSDITTLTVSGSVLFLAIVSFAVGMTGFILGLKWINRT
jgi:hypothetical protein